MALNGIDISSYQAGLNLNSVALDFVIIKATQGTDYVNPYCDIHYQQAVAKGAKRGVYHFANHLDARQEAEYFVNNILGYLGDAILVLDWEGSFVWDTAWAKAWLDRVQELTSVKPLIYMSESVANRYNWSDVINADYGLWVAKYWDMDIDTNYDMSNAGPEPNVNWGAAGYAMWQWSSTGRLSGYNGNLDIDQFYGSKETWDAYAKLHKSVPAPAPVVTTELHTDIKVVPFLKQTVADPTLPTGLTHVTQAGVDGVQQIVTQITKTDGVETSRVVISDTTTIAPVTEITTVGTKAADTPVEPTPQPVQGSFFTELAQILKALIALFTRKRK